MSKLANAKWGEGRKKKESIMLQIVQETVISIFGEFFVSSSSSVCLIFLRIYM